MTEVFTGFTRVVMIRERLETYRRQKRNEEMKESLKNSLKGLLTWSSNSGQDETLNEVTADDHKDDKDDESTCSEDSVEDASNSILTKVTNVLYFLLWVTLYIITIEYQFGTVYLILSMLFFIWLNTGSKPRKKGVPSAYSVFNPNCEAIQGTLDASQFEREIRYGGLR